jgi:hypothetical protein
MDSTQLDLLNELLGKTAFEGQPTLLPLVIQLGANVNSKNSRGISPLYLAATRARTEAEHQNDDKVVDYLKVIDTLVDAKATLSDIALFAGEKPFDGAYKVNSKLMAYLEDCKMKKSSTVVQATAKDVLEHKVNANGNTDKQKKVKKRQRKKNKLKKKDESTEWCY